MFGITSVGVRFQTVDHLPRDELRAGGVTCDGKDRLPRWLQN